MPGSRCFRARTLHARDSSGRRRRGTAAATHHGCSGAAPGTRLAAAAALAAPPRRTAPSARDALTAGPAGERHRRQPRGSGKGEGGRKRTCRTVHRSTSARLRAAQACRQPRSGSGSGSGPVPRRRFMAAAIARRRFPALAADWRERTSPRQQGSTGPRGRAPGRRGAAEGQTSVQGENTESQNQLQNTPSWKRSIRSPAPTPGSMQYPIGNTPRELSKRFWNSSRLVAVTPTLGRLFQCPTLSWRKAFS